MKRTPDNTELLLLWGLIIIFGLCPPLGVIIWLTIQSVFAD